MNSQIRASTANQTLRDRVGITAIRIACEGACIPKAGEPGKTVRARGGPHHRAPAICCWGFLFDCPTIASPGNLFWERLLMGRVTCCGGVVTPTFQNPQAEHCPNSFRESWFRQCTIRSAGPIPATPHHACTQIQGCEGCEACVTTCFCCATAVDDSACAALLACVALLVWAALSLLATAGVCTAFNSR